MQAIRANRLKPAIRNFSPPKRFAKERGSVPELAVMTETATTAKPAKNVTVASCPVFCRTSKASQGALQNRQTKPPKPATPLNSTPPLTQPPFSVILTETIREDQAMRANLRIESRESGHLSTGILPAPADAWQNSALHETPLTLQSLLFSISMLFFRFPIFLVFFCVCFPVNVQIVV